MRLRSLDVFRGITVAAMILVNNPGDWAHIYAPLEHAPWNGWTPTDLIFPFFLFIVGVSITYALRGHQPLARNQFRSTPGVKGKIIRRGLTLIALGLFLNLFPRFDFANVRIPGVLQRIGLVYIVCSLIWLRYTARQQAVLAALILLGYYLIMTLIPVPGVGYANLEPGTNIAAWLDVTLLTPAHLYRATRIWDPEGILSTLPAVATGLLGMQAGWWLQDDPYGPTARKSYKPLFLFLSGAWIAGVGLLVDYVFPINKSLWTSSFVLLAGGLAMCCLAICYYLVDLKGYRRWSGVFVAYGVNAITVFFLSGLIPRIMNMFTLPNPKGGTFGVKEYLYQSFIVPLVPDPTLASLVGALTLVGIWAVILWVMYRQQVIIKV
ncbi:acyltransferase family protein [Fibrella aquatilis]|uniref:DUF1624 domain-containing protein n=1 Tax=Fibrella aquatilis TaxID=2817059 RepID=A0A939GE53_9BACT|nr:heparan-alpha-glucosaminide N-acetyltransferase domain-containing protein [Fibrella aquatilis]MBO0934758.1 DUF1624 domain-containing protein [Fibrella aquatilis]